MMQKRFTNYIMTHPYECSLVGELHANDFIDFFTRGQRLIIHKPRGNGSKVMGVPIDLEPVISNPKLNNPQLYAYMFTAITVRATALLRFVDQPCLLGA